MNAQDGDLPALFRKNLPEFHWQRVETGGTGRGIPDSNYCLDGREGWVEFKTTESSRIPSLARRSEQIGWHLRRHRAGGRTFFAVRWRHDGGQRRGDSIDELWMVRGKFAEHLRDNGLAGLPVLETALRELGGPRSWSWDRVRSLLLD